MPAPQKLPSGRVRDLLVLSVTKLIVVSVRQLSTAKGPSCARAQDHWGSKRDRELGTGTGGSKLGTGNWGGRELATGNWDRELGTWDRDRDLGWTGNWGQGSEGIKLGQDLGQGTGDKDLGAGNWGRESCTRESQMIRDFPGYRRVWPV